MGGSMPADTKTRILDAAERLFAVHGIQGTGLRLISRKARVNLAAINYHFGSKENLVRRVVARLILPLDRERDRLLQEAGAGPDGTGPAVAELVRAFLMPWVSFRSRHPEYLRIIARTYSGQQASDGLFQDMLRVASRDAYALFTRGVAHALPEVPRERLLRRVNLAVAGAASFLLTPWLIEGLEDLSGLPMDEQVLMDHLTRLLESGD